MSQMTQGIIDRCKLRLTSANGEGYIVLDVFLSFCLTGNNKTHQRIFQDMSEMP